MSDLFWSGPGRLVAGNLPLRQQVKVKIKTAKGEKMVWEDPQDELIAEWLSNGWGIGLQLVVQT